jgi:hypothetical protein
MTVPHYISDDNPDMRGIKFVGTHNDGNPVSGPFASREKCMERNI